MSFSTEGLFGGQSRYIVELSDAEGSFDGPTELANDVNASSFDVTIPNGTPPGCGD